VAVIEIASSTDEDSNSVDDIDSSSESDRSLSPALLLPAQGQIDVIFNQKSFSSLYSSNLDANILFDAFIDRLIDCIAKKAKQSKDIIQRARKTYRYIWMTKAKSQ
jgi:hypothetical protein